MKNKKAVWLFRIGLAVLLLGVAAMVGSIICELIGNSLGLHICSIIIIVCGPVSILLLILRFALYGGTPSPSAYEPPVRQRKVHQENIHIVDVKKSKDEEMYERYVDLYNRNIISKEDLDKKRIELLGK